jgi:anaerobic magnesium-protoporphyrin IX monomethyl ester cyclase
MGLKNMLSIAFVIAPENANFNPFRNQPLTAFHLLTILEKRFRSRISLEIIDLRGIRLKDVKYYILRKDLYFYTAMTPEFDPICQVVDIIRSIYPKSLHAAGGAHFNLFPESKGFDVISIGEGEESIVEIVNDAINGKTKSVYKNNKGIIDLNAYPYPLRKYLPKPAIVEKGVLDGEHIDLPGTNVLFSRGCPFACKFCANYTFGKTRYRSPKHIEEEIEYLKKEYGVKALALKDDNGIPYNKKIAGPFLDAIGRTGVKWRGQSRANGIDEETVKIAAESGCVSLGLGIESVSQKTLEIVEKKINLEKAREYIDLLKKYGIGARLHFILGLPGEPDDIVELTVQFIEKVKPSSVLLNLFTPIPGSDISLNPKKYGMKILAERTEMMQTVFGRFDENEKPHMLYEYLEETPWGKGKSSKKIIAEYTKLQAYLRDNDFIF